MRHPSYGLQRFTQSGNVGVKRSEVINIYIKSLILAQDERWRRA